MFVSWLSKKSLAAAGVACVAAAGLAGNEAFTAGTIGQTVDTITRVTLPTRRIDFSLGSPLMGYSLGGQTFGAVPPRVTLKSVTLYDLADLGTGGSLGAASLPTVSLYANGGGTLVGTANRTTVGEAVVVRLADGSETMLTPVTYSFVGEPVEVDGSATYRLTLNAVGVVPTLPLFTNAATQGASGFDLADVFGVAPFLTISGEADVTEAACRAEGEASLADLSAGTADAAGTVIAVTLAAGATLTLDRVLDDATLVLEAEGAATVVFRDARLACPFVFRNAPGVTDGVITVSGPWEDAEATDAAPLWQPDSLAVDCDLVLASPLPRIVAGWFQANAVRVASGHTLRLATEATVAERLPLVALSAPDATLAFADASKANGTLPAAYDGLFAGSSGTVALERAVSFKPTSGFASDEQGAYFRLGCGGEEGYVFTLDVLDAFTTTTRLFLGGPSGAATLRVRTDKAVSIPCLWFDGNARLEQASGALTLGSGGWFTRFNDGTTGNTLVFGDADASNGLAEATLSGIVAGTGAADLTVNADATLTLNKIGNPYDKEQDDYAFYPLGARTLKVVGGTVRAASGAAVTMAFEAPEPQAAPMAVAPVPGLEVVGAASLESDNTTDSSLTLDSLKGSGAVTLSGVVNIGAVRLDADATLSLDLRRGEGDVDDAIGGSAVKVASVAGAAGTVRFGLLGANGTTGEQTVINSLLAGGFTGTVGFLTPDYPVVDFADTQLPILPFTLEVQPGQTVVMRLDQYVDAKLLWPEDPAGAHLVLIEAGPYGGEVSLPAWPEGVEMAFHRYDGTSAGHSALPETDFTVGRNDDGLTIDLTWKNPVLTGKVAWLDMEFNGDSYNTGWYNLGAQNGMLRGDDNSNEIMTDGGSFTEMRNPASEGVNGRRQAYIAPHSLEAYPDSWSVVARITAAEINKSVMIAIGANYKDVTGGTGDDFSDRDTLVLATGSMKDHGAGTSAGNDDHNDNMEDTIRLWLIRGSDLYETQTLPAEPLAEAAIPQITERPHLYSVFYENRRVRVYVDGHQLLDTTLPQGINLGPGLQFGKLMGGDNISEDALGAVGEQLADSFREVSGSSGDGGVDFLRVYRGVLTDKALDLLVRANPYIHTDPGSDLSRHRDVRYYRKLSAGAVENWVQEGAWQRQHNRAGTTATVWEDDGTYAEPAEGSIVVVEVPEGTATLLVNTEKHDLFPSANRTYSTLIVSGQEPTWGDVILGIDQTVSDDDWTGGQLILAPIGYTAENAAIDKNVWESRTDDGAFRYGTLRFSGGIGQTIPANKSALGTFFNSERPKAAYFLTDTRFYASVVDLNAVDGVEVNANVTVRAYVDDSMLRDVDDELVVRQITGPVTGCDGGYGSWERNTSVSMATDHQKSDYVYPDRFDERVSAWLFDDATVEYNSGLSLYDAPPVGLFVRCLKIPGRLYLELNESDIQADGVLSQQEWYRYGYKGDDATVGVSRIAPAPMQPGDFEKAVALSIRLKNGETKTLYSDAVADGLTINELTIEKPKADDGAANETLRILPQTGTDNCLKVLDDVSTVRRLEVYSADGAGSEASAQGADGVRLASVYDAGLQANVGAKLYGIETGAYVAGNSAINHALDGSSIARIESAGTIRFAAAQDLSATTLATQENTLIEQTGAEAAFTARALELAAGSRFRFASSTATIAEGITLLGPATLEGTGAAATLTPTAGVSGTAGTETLTLDAAEGADWKLLNNTLNDLPLTKTGAGAADIATALPPTASVVDVQAGTLRVATGVPGTAEAVGRGSLNVAAGAILAPTAGTVLGDALAEIPDGRAVSGLGRIDGVLRLGRGATLDATDATAEASLSVGSVSTDGAAALADINVALPSATEAGLVFLRSDETALNWAARARLLAMAGETRWDVLLRYRPDPSTPVGTDWLVDVPGLDVPVFPPDGEQPDEGENTWPDAGTVADDVSDQAQGDGQIAGGSEGYTMAGTRRLTAQAISDAYACFRNVWVLAPRTADPTREDYATVDLLMAYEFGISRMARVSDAGTEKVLVEVTLRNALGQIDAFRERNLQGADAWMPAFGEDVALTLVGPDGTPFADATEIDAERAEALGFAPRASAIETARWFLIPYDEAHFPAGEAVTVEARAGRQPTVD